MTLRAILLSHLLHGLFRRHRKPLVASPGSVATPLGYVPYQRRIDTEVRVEDGIERARKTRRYAGRIER
jgi:hypothetical protein